MSEKIDKTARGDSRPTGEAEQQLRPTGPDQAAIGAARKDVEAAAKSAGKAAKELAEAALQLQMEAINGQPEFEPDLLETAEVLQKKYTAAGAKQNEMRRQVCIYMLARGIPVEDIMRLLVMNWRTVMALAKVDAAQLATDKKDFAEWLRKGSAKAFQVALLKIDDANSLQAATVGGIMADKAAAVEGGIPQGAGEEPVIDVTAEDEDLKKFRDGLKGLKSAKAVETFNIEHSTSNIEGGERKGMEKP